MKEVDTFEAKIYVSLQAGYNKYATSTIDQAHMVCHNYCKEVGLCVTLTPTTFIHTEGYEGGFVVGLINYPRFPSTEKEILKHAKELAKRLKKRFSQYRVSIVSTHKTIMYGPVE